jgi:hypothetical protein
LAGLGFRGLEERGGFDEGIPLMARRALARPLDELVAATVTEEDGRRFHISILHGISTRASLQGVSLK